MQPCRAAISRFRVRAIHAHVPGDAVGVRGGLFPARLDGEHGRKAGARDSGRSRERDNIFQPLALGAELIGGAKQKERSMAEMTVTEAKAWLGRGRGIKRK